MSVKKIETVLSLIEVADRNLKNAQTLLLQITQEKGIKVDTANTSGFTPGLKSRDEEEALEVAEGYFDGENMHGDNGQTYPVPQNYASKTQLVVGDRMKWILTQDREIFKLIQPTPRVRASGTFAIEGDQFVVLIDELSTPIKILKASATYAMKNLGLKVGDEVAIYIPKDATATWGAFISVVKPGSEESRFDANHKLKVKEDRDSSAIEEDIKEFKLTEDKPASEVDYF